MRPLLLAFASVLLSVAAQFLMKRGVHGVETEGVLGAVGLLLRPLVMLGFGCYAASAVIWMQVLSRWDVSKAYPMVGLGFVLTLIVGAMIGEAVSFTRVVGTLLICVGVLLVART